MPPVSGFTTPGLGSNPTGQADQQPTNFRPEDFGYRSWSTIMPYAAIWNRIKMADRLVGIYGPLIKLVMIHQLRQQMGRLPNFPPPDLIVGGSPTEPAIPNRQSGPQPEIQQPAWNPNNGDPNISVGPQVRDEAKPGVGAINPPTTAPAEDPPPPVGEPVAHPNATRGRQYYGWQTQGQQAGLFGTFIFNPVSGQYDIFRPMTKGHLDKLGGVYGNPDLQRELAEHGYQFIGTDENALIGSPPPVSQSAPGSGRATSSYGNVGGISPFGPAAQDSMAGGAGVPRPGYIPRPGYEFYQTPRGTWEQRPIGFDPDWAKQFVGGRLPVSGPNARNFETYYGWNALANQWKPKAQFARHNLKSYGPGVAQNPPTASKRVGSIL